MTPERKEEIRKDVAEACACSDSDSCVHHSEINVAGWIRDLLAALDAAEEENEKLKEELNWYQASIRVLQRPPRTEP